MSEVEIIMGTKGSGKTLFLNSYLEMTNLKKERMLLIIIDDGNTKLIDKFKDVYIKVKIFNSVFEISENKLMYLINIYKPHRILVEGNYVSSKHIYQLFLKEKLKKCLIISSIIEIINSRDLYKVTRNKLNRIESNIIIINNYDKNQVLYEHIESIKLKNKTSFVFFIEDFREIYKKFKNYQIIKSDMHRKIFKYLKEYIVYI